ncbi:MAG TPA: hypothetical protein VLH75_20560 [Longimicrobiales bacterium]|nr:hypothetical protein [Longimicrobiales bacterium]
MKSRTFRQVTDELCLTADELVAVFERAGRKVSLASVRQARMNPGTKGYRAPPDGWEAVLLDVARKRGRDMAGLVKELEAFARQVEEHGAGETPGAQPRGRPRP